jgi:shikimate dehydrogenase
MSTPPTLRQPEISGETRLIAVLGDPVAQVRAPGLVNPLLAELGVNTVVIPVHAAPAELDDVVRGLKAARNVTGLLVTVPHKIAMLRHADEHSRAATLAGSTNALRRRRDGSWHADNFDGAGFVAGLKAAGHAPAGRTVALVGAGGAGVAIAPALLSAGVARLSVSDLDHDRARTLAERLAAVWPGQVEAVDRPRVRDADLAVNATPLGLRPTDELPFDPSAVRPDAVVADIIMKPRQTRLLRTAAELGRAVHFGEPMLAHQVELYRAYFGFDQQV